jgi:threonine dehydratase
MGGLRCGEMSPVAFETLATLVDAYVAIEDQWALRAVRLLATPTGGDPQIAAGASGAAGLGGLLACLQDPLMEPVRRVVSLGSDTRVLVIVSEGVTDAAAFEEALSRG